MKSKKTKYVAMKKIMENVKYWRTKSISFILVMALFMPLIPQPAIATLSGDALWLAEDTGYFDTPNYASPTTISSAFPQASPYDWEQFAHFEIEGYNEARLRGLLARNDRGEFDSFTAEEQHIVLEHLGLLDEPLSPEELEELIRAQEEYLSQCWLERERLQFATLLSRTAAYSALDDDSRDLLFRHLDIAYEALVITGELFSQMERDGLTLADSAEIVRIIATGLFDHQEARSIIQAIPASDERLAAIAQFESFARRFDIAAETNARRLSNGIFASVNDFGEVAEPRVGTITELPARRRVEATYSFIDAAQSLESGEARRGGQPPQLGLERALEERVWATGNIESIQDCPAVYATFRAFTSAGAFDEARRMFLDGHSVPEIEAAFALGAALQVEPRTFMLQPGVYAAGNAANGWSSHHQFIPNHQTEISAEAWGWGTWGTETWGIGAAELSMEASPTTIRGRVAERGEQNPFNAEAVRRAVDADADELGLIIGYGLMIMSSGITPASAGTTAHETIIANPFALGFNANESVILNTGAVVYRENILSLPGRNGFGLSLDLVYNSVKSDLRRPVPWGWVNGVAERFDLHGLGAGWMFDLPYIQDNALYLPGRGAFELVGNNFRDHTLQDMALIWYSNFTSGSLRSDRRLRFHDGTRYYFDGARVIGMADRFNNTIRFEYGNISQFGNMRLLTRIVDSNGRIINFAYAASGNNRAVTVTSPDGGSYVINMSRIPGHWASSNSDFQIDRIRNQMNDVNLFTSFTYDIRESWFCLFCKFPNCPGLNMNRTVLLTRVNYPSGAQLLFSYAHGNINLGQSGARGKWSVTMRALRNSADGRDYQLTTFSYNGCFTTGHTYAVTVWQYRQTNGLWNLRTEYTFNHRHLNTNTRVYNVNTLLSNQTTTYNPNWLPASIELTEHHGGRTRTTTQSFLYNQFGQVTRRISPLAQGNSTVQRYWTDYEYDNRFGIVTRRITRPNAATTVEERNALSADGRSIIRSYVYENNARQSRTDFYRRDAHGNATVIREFPDSRGSAFIETQITYNSGTMPSQITSGNGLASRSFTYDTMWRVLSETDPNGYITRWQYDMTGRITRITFPNGGIAEYRYNDTANTVTHTTVLGATYVYRYTGLGKLHTVTANDLGTPGNNVVILTNTYDPRMRLIETRTAQGIASSQHTTFEYDIFDRVTEERRLNAAGGIMHHVATAYHDIFDAALNSRIVTTVHGDANAPKIVSFVQYDRFGRRNQEGVNGGRIVTYTHDLAGRVTQETSLGVDNRFTHNVFGVTAVTNILGSTATNEYNSIGRLIRSTDFMGNRSRFTYDALGRLIRQDVPFEHVDGVLWYAVTWYFYDNNGNVIRTTTTNGLPAQARTYASTENTFRHNRLMSSQTGSTGVNGIRTDYTYDLAGNVLTKRVGGTSATAGGAVTTFRYDNRGRLTRVTNASGQQENFTYDNNSLRLTRTDGNGIIFRKTYDNMGRVIREEAVQNGAVVAYRTRTYNPAGAVCRITSGAHTIAHYYDGQGRLRLQTETGGVRKYYTYNAADNRASFRLTVHGALHMNTTYTYDAAQRLRTVVENGALQVTYSYNANGQVTARALSNGTTTTYTHNLAGLVTNVRNHHGAANLSNFAYTHHLDGNVRQFVETIGGTTRTVNYRYDTARRLVSEQDTFTGLTRAYAFDARGNRTRMTVTTTATGAELYRVDYTHGSNNRVNTEVRTGQNPSTTTFAHDNNVNMLRRYVNGVLAETKTYNVWGELTRVVRPGMTADYTYRADGLRHTKTVNGVRTTHVWDGAHMAAELNASGVAVIRFTRGRGGRLIHSQHHGWYLHNARGDVVQRVNGAGAAWRTYRYTAFGVELNPVANPNPFRFAGEYYDAETGRIYLRARFYDPRLGRFTQPDPFWGIHNMQNCPLSIMQAGNLFVGKLNNPVMFVDPTGLAVWFIHGTWPNLSNTRFEDEIMEFVAGHFGQRHFDPPWTGQNNARARRTAANNLVGEIRAFHEDNPFEPIRLVGHSHGGNVAIMAANSLAEYGIRVETLITFATPVREHQILHHNLLGQHINVFNRYDPVQIAGGGLYGLAGRTFSQAENMEIFIPRHQRPGSRPIDILQHSVNNHEVMHNSTRIWENNVLPAITQREGFLSEWGFPKW